MRRAGIRRLTAGIALAATILHVAFLSMHVAMMASLALAGDAMASQSRFGFVICGPARLAADPAISQAGSDADAPASSRTETATFCPVCTGGALPALILPDAPPLPAYVALDVLSPVAVTPAIAAPCFESLHKQSRGPPSLI